jgi:hypothetical protein
MKPSRLRRVLQFLGCLIHVKLLFAVKDEAKPIFAVKDEAKPFETCFTIFRMFDTC